MSGIASSPVAPPRYIRQHAPRPRSDAKRSRIIDAAMQHFAENGYHAARVGDIAATPQAVVNHLHELLARGGAK